MLLLMYVLFIQNLYILYFSNFCINNDAIFCSILQLCKISGPIFSYSKIFTDEFILQIYLVLICFISTLIFLTFFYLHVFKMCLFDMLFIKIEVIFIKFQKRQNSFRPIANSISIVGLPQHYTIFSAADWNNNTTSSFPPVNW